MKEVKKLRQRWKQGSIVQIDLKDGTFAYGLVLEAEIAFYDHLVHEKDLPCDLEILQKKRIIFQIGVDHYCVTQMWPIIGKIQYDPKLEEWKGKWTYDNIAGKYYIWENSEQRPATWEECKDLEKFSSWGCGAVEQRLRDHFAGRPCWYREINRPGVEFVPIKEFYARYGYNFYFLDHKSHESSF